MGAFGDIGMGGGGGHGCISGVWWEHGVRTAFVRDSRTWDGGLAMGLVAGRQ